jgi:hypothetical protein
MSDQVREATLGTAEMRYPYPEKQRDDTETQKEARNNIERALPAQHTPAEPVTHDWIESVPESPLLGHDGTRESDIL